MHVSSIYRWGTGPTRASEVGRNALPLKRCQRRPITGSDERLDKFTSTLADACNDEDRKTVRVMIGADWGWWEVGSGTGNRYTAAICCDFQSSHERSSYASYDLGMTTVEVSGINVWPDEIEGGYLNIQLIVYTWTLFSSTEPSP